MQQESWRSDPNWSALDSNVIADSTSTASGRANLNPLYSPVPLGPGLGIPLTTPMNPTTGVGSQGEISQHNRSSIDIVA